MLKHQVSYKWQKEAHCYSLKNQFKVIQSEVVSDSSLNLCVF